MGKEWKPDDVFDVLGSEPARRILVFASAEPISAEELAEQMDASLPTIYRRLDALQEYDLLDATVRIDDQGNRYRLFETAVRRLVVAVDDDGIEVDVEPRGDMVDQFETFWDDLERASREGGDDG